MSAAMALDPLGFNMEEVIAALPTQQERDELTLFIEEHLKRGTGAGILRGLFLLLKANRCYLEKLPGQFNRDLVKPMIENLQRIEAGFALHSEMQEKALGQMERCATSSTRAADRMEAVVPKVEGVVQTAFDNINSSALTSKFEDSIMEGVVKPVAKVNDKCDKLQDKLDNRLPVLMSALKWVNIWSFLTCLAACLLLIGAIAIYDVFSMEQKMVSTLQTRVKEEIEKVHATAKVNEQTLDALAQLNVAIEINPEKDWRGNVMPYHYCISIKGADSGATIYKNWQRYGAIFVHEEITPLSL